MYMYLYARGCMYDVVFVMLLLALVFATMQQVNIAVISLRSCKHYDSLKSHISPIGLGATFLIIA